MKRNKFHLVGAAVVTSSILLPVVSIPLAAQPIEAVVITAQRREQSKQDVPISVAAYGEEFLRASKIEGVSDLVDYTPGLSGSDVGTGTPIFAIRGISSNSFGIGGEASVGVFVDDAYLGRITTSSLSFIDVSRVEVLKGPQGTLFGRNSSAGAISIITNEPNDTPSLDLFASGSRFSTYSAEATGNLPLSDSIFSRGTLLHQSSDGHTTNVVDGEDLDDQNSLGGRFSVLFDGDPVRVRLSAYGQRDDTNGPGYETADPTLAGLGGLPADPFDGKIASDLDLDEDREVYGVVGRVEAALSDTIDLTSITTFNRYDYNALFDIDGSALFIFNADFQKETADTLGQEFRLNGEAGSIVWLLGASYFYEDIEARTQVQYNDFNVVGGTPVPADALFGGSPAFFACDAVSDGLLGACSAFETETVVQSGEYNSYALYGDATFAVTDRLNISGGLRMSYDEKSFDFNAPAVTNVSTLLVGSNLTGFSTMGTVSLEDSWFALQPRLAVDYAISDDILGYASVSRGFKSGGFDPAPTPQLSQFDEETVWSYEVGLKSTLADGRVQFNLAGYYQDYDGFQVQVVRNGVASTINVPKVEGLGIEADIVAQPIDGLTILAAGTASRSEMKDLVTDSGDLSGNTTIRSPDYTASVVGQYTFNQDQAWQPFVRAEVAYESEQFFTIDNRGAESQGGYALVNARIGVTAEDGRWSASVFGKNLTDKKYLNDAQDFGFGLLTLSGTPRVIGGEVAVRF